MKILCLACLALTLCRTSANCPHGFWAYEDGCYFLSDQLKNFTECQSDVCAARNATLAAVRDEGLNEALRRALEKYPKSGAAYIGLYNGDAGDADQWSWVDGSRMGAALWNERGPGSCSQLKCALARGGVWHSVPCNMQVHCFCSLGGHVSERYLAAEANLTAEVDMSVCDRKDGVGELQRLLLVSFDVAFALVAGVAIAVGAEWFHPRRRAPADDHSVEMWQSISGGGERPPGESRVDTSALAGVRALLMMTVATNHFCIFFHPRVFGSDLAEVLQGGGATTGFLVLSGFVMAVAHSKGDLAGDTPAHLARRRNFYVKRFARLAPMYYLSLLLDPSVLRTLGVLAPFCAASTLTVTQAWLPFLNQWNGVLWTVSTIVFFYFRFPYLMPRVRKWQKRSNAVRLCAALVALRYVKCVNPSKYQEARTSPPDVIGTFLIGVLAGLSCAEAVPGNTSQVRLRWVRYANCLSLLVALWLTSVGVLCAMHGGLSAYGIRVAVEAIIALPFARWLEALTMAGPRAFLARCFALPCARKLGEWSYAIYCLQIPVWSWCVHLRGSAWGGRAFRGQEPFLAMAALLLAAGLATELVERPLQARLQRWLCVAVPPDAPDAEGGAPITLAVMVPAGYGPGMQMRVGAPTGQEAVVEIPAGAGPGTVIQVQVPADAWPDRRRGDRCDEYSPESGRCFIFDPDADGELTISLYYSLTCLFCIPKRECCCFNPLNPRAGCGNRCRDCWPGARAPAADALAAPPDPQTEMRTVLLQ